MEWARRKGKALSAAMRELDRYGETAKGGNVDWIESVLSQIAAADVFGRPSTTRKVLKAFTEDLKPDEIALAERFRKVPWRYCLFTVKDEPAPEFLEIVDVEHDEEHLLYSPAVTELYHDGVRLFLCLLFYNGECFQTYSTIHPYRSFQPGDLAVFATLASGRRQQRIGVAEIAAMKPVVLFRLDTYGSTPPIAHGKQLVRELSDSFATDLDADEVGRLLGEDWERNECGSVTQFSRNPVEDSFYFVNVYVDPDEKLIVLDSNSEDLYRTTVRLLKPAARAGGELSEDPFWNVTMNMAVAVERLLEFPPPARAYDELFSEHDHNTGGEADSADDPDGMDRFNAALRTIMDARNNGVPVSVEEVLERHGIDPESADGIRDLLSRLDDNVSIDLPGGFEGYEPPPPVARMQFSKSLARADQVQFRDTEAARELFAEIEPGLTSLQEELGVKTLALSRLPSFIDTVFHHELGDEANTCLMYSLYLLDHFGDRFRPASDYASELLRLFWQMLIDDGSDDQIAGFISFYENTVCALLEALGLVETSESGRGPQMKASRFFDEWLETRWDRGAARENVPNASFEEALERFLLDTGRQVSLQEVAHLTPEAPTEEIAAVRIKATELAFPLGHDEYLPRSHYFRDGVVLVKPSEEEIESGVLIPGHRFLPFYYGVLLPHELSLLEEDTDGEVARRTVVRPLSALEKYYELFGPQGLPYLVTMEDETNEDVIDAEPDDARAVVRVSAFDLGDFYARHGFKTGDYISCRLVDYENGCFKIGYLSAEQAADRDADEWRQDLDLGFEESFRYTQSPVDPIEQIAHAFFFAGRSVVTRPAYDLSTYVEMSDTVGFLEYGTNVYLWYKDADPESVDIFSGRGPAYTGDTSGLDEILADCGFAYSASDIEAIMRDAVFTGRDFEHAYSALIPGYSSPFANAEQEAAFRKECEDMFMDIRSSQDSDQDKEVALLRSSLVGLLQKQVAWLRRLDARGVDPSDLPREPVLQLTELSSLISSALQFLNDTPESDEDEMSDSLQKIAGSVERLEESMDELTAEVEEAVFGGEQGGSPRASSGKAERNRTPRYVYQLKITLEGIRPPIWRRIRIPGTYSLGDLHQVIQTLFDWDGTHLHDFVVGDREYSDLNQIDGGVDGEFEERGTTLEDLELSEKAWFRYTYDFGDNWSHKILVEKVVDAAELSEDERSRVTCITGRRGAPPEDCGGPPGYLGLLDLLDTPQEQLDAEDTEFLEWVGDLDPEHFDVEQMNRKLRRADR